MHLACVPRNFEDFGPQFLYRVCVPTDGNLLKDQPFMEISKKGWPNWVFELDALYDWRTNSSPPRYTTWTCMTHDRRGTCCIRGDTRDGDGLFSLLGICGGCVLFWCCVFCLFVKCAWCKWKISNWKRGCKGKYTKKNATGKWFKRNNMAATLFFFIWWFFVRNT